MRNVRKVVFVAAFAVLLLGAATVLVPAQTASAWYPPYYGGYWGYHYPATSWWGYPYYYPYYSGYSYPYYYYNPYNYSYYGYNYPYYPYNTYRRRW